MDAPAFSATSFARPALLTIALYVSIILISTMTMVNPAHASGIVSPTTLYHAGGNNSGFNCANMTSLGAVQSCELAKHDKWLADDLTYFNSIPNAIGNPLSCPTAVLADSGPTSPYIDIFGITYYRGSYSVGGFWIPIYYLYCDGPHVDNHYMSTQLSCPANSTQTGSTCTCNDNYVSAGTSCIPETYTIALSGLGVEVMPTKTRDAYALVTTTTGSLKSGAQVSLALTVVPENDGLLYAAHVGAVSPNGGSTEADGRLSFVFTAPVRGGLHTITATCTNCTNQATRDDQGARVPDPALDGADRSGRDRF